MRAAVTVRVSFSLEGISIRKRFPRWLLNRASLVNRDLRTELFVVNLLEHVFLVVSILGDNHQLLVVHKNLIVATVEESKLVIATEIIAVNCFLQQLIPTIFLLLFRNYFDSVEKVLKD